MSDALDPTRKDLLSSHLDHEIPADEHSQDAESLIQGHFGAQLHYRNLETVRRATQQTGVPMPPADDFLGRIMGAIDGLEQEDPAEDFEVLSAWCDGEWELETLSETADFTRRQIDILHTALTRLPLPPASADFTDRVMAAVDRLQTPSGESLSALFDKEPVFSEVRCLQGAELPAAAVLQLQNFYTLSKALRQLPAPTAPAGFAERVLAALPAADADFDALSAYYDAEATLALSQTPALLGDFARLSAAMQALPAPTPSAAFAEGVMRAINTAEHESLNALHDGEASELTLNPTQEQTLRQLETLSAGFATLPQVAAPAGFAERVLRAIEADFAQVSAHHDGELAELSEAQQAQLPLLAALSAGFAALPEVQAPEGFAAGVMQAIEALPDFETVSAVFDGEASGVALTEFQLQPLRALSRAMAALPQPEAPADFVAKVMLATEKVSRPKLFALPGLMQTRLGKIAAGFALFGMLAGMSYELKQVIDGGSQGNAAVPIVQVDNTPEELLFSNPEVNTVMDDTLQVDQPIEKDYNILIGG